MCHRLRAKELCSYSGQKGNVEKTERRLKKLQRALSKKQKGSKNKEKTRLKVARLHEKVKNQREDFLHKLSKRVVSENQAIILEDLNVKGLISGNLSKHIADTSWSKFVWFFSYKALWYGSEIIFVDTFYPSSKLCSFCGYKKGELTLSDRYWICPVCGTKHDRDANVGKNLLTYGLAQLMGSRVGTTRAKACGKCSGGGTEDIFPLVYES